MKEIEFEHIIHNIIESKHRLYKIAAYCALGIIVIYLIDLFVTIFYGSIISKTVPELFEIFQKSRLIGLLQAFTLDIIAAIIRIPLMIALFLSLIKIKKSFILLILSIVLGFIGISVYFSYNSVLSMVHLSDLYTMANNDTQKQQLIAAGYTFLSSFNANGTQPFMSFTLLGIWGILVSIVMYRSPDFGKTVSIIGIIGFILEQGPPAGLYPEIWGKIDPFLIGIGGVLIITWYFMIFIKFLRLSKLFQNSN